MRKYIFLLFLIMICHYPGFSEEISGKTILLEQLAFSKQDSSRLSTLLQLVNVTYQDPKEQANYVARLLEEAEKQKSNYYICQAYLRYMVLGYNKYDGEEVNKWMKLLEPLARKEKFHDLLFRGKQCVIDMLLLKEQYELEEKEATQMLKEAKELNNIIGQIGAYHSLAHVYMRTYRQDKAFEVLEKAVLLGPACSNQFMYSELLRTMTLNCEDREDFPNWFKYLQKRDSLTAKLEKENPLETFDGDRLINNISFLRYYLKCKKWEEAAQCLNEMDRNYSEQYSTAHKYYYREIRTKYFTYLKEWDKALQEIDVLLELLKSMSQVGYTNILVAKAQLLSKIHRDQEACVIHRQAKLLKDSLSISTINKQTEQLKNAYKTDLQILSTAQQQQRIQQVFLTLAIIIILILAISIIHAKRIKRKLTKAEREMREMMDETEQANKIKECFLTNINKTIRPPLEIIVKNSSRLASEEEIEAGEKEKLSDLITTTSELLMELINEILILSKLEAKMMKFSIKKVEAIQFTKSIIQIMNQKAPNYVVTNINDGDEAIINGDENYLKQIISSLCRQPITEKKSIFLRIEKTDAKELKIIVKNTMLAIPEQSQEIVIRNEINRMLTESFGGQYTRSCQEGVPCIILTFKMY